MTQEYILLDIEQRRGFNGVDFYRLTFQHLDTNQIVEMTVDRTYKNFHSSGWNHVIDDPCPWGVYTDLKQTRRTTRSGHSVVTADSPARILVRLESQQQALDLAQASIDLNSPGQRFREVFE